MAGALLGRALKTHALKPSQIRFLASDYQADRARTRCYRIRPSSDLQALSRFSDVILLGVKPFQLADVLGGLAPVYRHQPVWTIAAGPSVSFYRRHLGRRAPVIRIMPNMPSALGQGANGVYFPPGLSPRTRLDCLQFLQHAGHVEIVKSEKLLDAVLAVAGSGPAFFYSYAKAIIQAGVALGLSRTTADRLTRKMLLGSALVLNASNQLPAELIAAVASPRGTTIKGLDELAKNGFAKIVTACLRQAAKRSAEIGREVEDASRIPITAGHAGRAPTS